MSCVDGLSSRANPFGQNGFPIFRKQHVLISWTFTAFVGKEGGCGVGLRVGLRGGLCVCVFLLSVHVCMSKMDPETFKN